MSLASTDPSDIANGARCFSSCITGVNESAVKTYLLTNGAGRSLPPCVTPSAPITVEVTTAHVPDSNTQLGVRWLQAANSGTLITGYTVYWGTTAGGPYTNNSGLLPVAPKFYIASGLTAGTTYYFVVVANTNVAGCSSANSAEANATTTGNAPTGLQVGLVSYWKLDEASGAVRVDSVGTNNASQGVDTVGNDPNGVINSAALFTLAGAGLQIASNSTLQFGAGVSKSFSLWFRTTTIVFSQVILSKWNQVGADQEYILFQTVGAITFRTRNLANGANVDVVSTIAAVANRWIHISFGYDDASQVIWIQIEGETRQTTASTGIRSSGVQFRFGSSVDFSTGGSFGLDGSLDEGALWSRVLTSAEVVQLAATFSLTGIQAGQTVGQDNATRWSAKVVSNGGAAPAASTTTAMSVFVDGCVTDGTYLSLLVWNIYAPDNLIAATTPWYRIQNGNTPFTNHNFVGGDITATGLKGNATTKYLDTGLNMSTLGYGWNAQSSAGIILYMPDVAATAASAFWDSGDIDTASSANNVALIPALASVTYYEMCGFNTSTPSVAINLNGFYSGQRTSGVLSTIYFANSGNAHASKATAVGAPAAALARNLYLFCANDNNGNTQAFFSSRTQGFFAVSLGLSSANDALVYGRVQTLMTAFGRQV